MTFLIANGSNVIEMNHTFAHKAGFAVLAQVEAYWHGLCKGMSLPNRQDIKPKGLDMALNNAFILERAAPGVFRFRIAGQHLCELMGLDVSGMPISAMFMPDARVEICKTVEEICAEPCIKEVHLCAGRSLGRGALKGKILLMPLLDDAGEITRILGCLQTTGYIGRQPRRFSITEVKNKEISIPTQPRQHPVRNLKHPAFAEAATPFSTASVTPASAPAAETTVERNQNSLSLKLVVNNA